MMRPNMVNGLTHRLLRKLGMRRLYNALIYPTVNRMFFEQAVIKTNNFSSITWLGKPIWQNVLDLWVIQETIWEVQPQLLIECGTNRGGSAYFYAQLFDLIGKGRVISIDIKKMHDITHPRIDFLIGSSIADDIVARVRQVVATIEGPVMVILDSNHSTAHVRKELELYADFVTSNSFLLVQDGIIDILPVFRSARPGPLPAIQDFLNHHPEFVAEVERSQKFLISHHPHGWLRRK